ncbi:unnamed protein product [Staurois parvus]|uniref:Secreted protein n=1 Tax=Staurois parvus TaxID=386267 RepID=A0ABN9HD68_9NEOB|nr:unnamed protein product [Staurois parvus]
MGLRFFRSVGSRVGFLSMGVMCACFRGEGNAPVERERLKMWVRERRMEEEGDRRSCVGTGSRGQVVRRASEKTLVTSSVVARLKERSVGEVIVCGMLGVVGAGRLRGQRMGELMGL